MNATDMLVEDHHDIARMLSVLERTCVQLETGVDVGLDHLDQLVDFFENFVSRYHLEKEEGLLFVALEEAGFPMAGGPAGALMLEHEMGRSYVKGMLASVREIRAGNKDGICRLVDHARNYISLVSGHLKKEEALLFPFAESHLSLQQQEALKKEFHLADSRPTGVDRSKSYGKLVDKLSRMIHRP